MADERLTKLISSICFKDDIATNSKTPAQNGEKVGSRLSIGQAAQVYVCKAIFPEHIAILPQILRDSCHINAYRNVEQETLTIPCFFEDKLVRLIKTRPLRSYLNVSFRQVMNYLLSHNGKHLDPNRIPNFLSFIHELRTSFNTMCHEDRQTLKTDLIYEDDASFLISWSTIEAIKYCISIKFSPEISASRFLGILQREIKASIENEDKTSRKFCINLLQNLDKFLHDRVQYSAIGRHTFQGSRNIEDFYPCNENIFQIWLQKNRHTIAKVSLISDDPAECWRNSSIELHRELQSDLSDIKIRSHIELMALSAKQLGDIDLLNGLRAMTNQGGSLFWCKSLDATLSQLKGSYQKTYDSFGDLQKPDDQCLIELLNSCIELDILEENSSKIEELASVKLKNLYNQYLKSKTIQRVDSQRLQEVSSLLKSWNSPSVDVQPARCYLDLIVPTCLNTIIKVPSEEDQIKLIEDTEWMISQDYMSQCLFAPSLLSKNMQVYHVILEMLKQDDPRLPCGIIEKHRNDLKWNHLLLKHLDDLNLTSDLVATGDELIDLIRLRSAKFHYKCKNQTKASNIIDDLERSHIRQDTKILGSLMYLKRTFDSKVGRNCDVFRDLMQQVNDASGLNISAKYDLSLKVMRGLFKIMPEPIDAEEIEVLSKLNYCEHIQEVDPILAKRTCDDSLKRWSKLLGSSSLKARAKTLLILSERAHRFHKIAPNGDKLNRAFDLDIELLSALCMYNSLQCQAQALECALRILETIVTSGGAIVPANHERVESPIFIKSTLSVWRLLKLNLINVISYHQNKLSESWKHALTLIIEHLVDNDPNLLLYSTIVNRLDLQLELKVLSGKSDKTFKDGADLLLISPEDCHERDNTPLCRKLESCQSKLNFWNHIFERLKSCGDESHQSKWPTVVQETERFLKEIRKISFLSGEYLKALTLRIPKKLENFLDYFAKYTDAKCGAILNKHKKEESEVKLKHVCDQAINQIRVLMNSEDKIDHTQLTYYEMWFLGTFKTHLCEAEYRLTLLAKKRPMILSELDKLVRSITELLSVCRNTILDFNKDNRQKMIMELISPVLSRLETSSIPMPECFDYPNGCGDEPTTRPVTIHKVLQTVNLISSKTSPKKIKITGSDGVTRSFLLKAHEDLRQDQMIMEFFASINKMLKGDMRTRGRHSISRYSVTPVSFRSGLIQWVDAPSICSFSRAWYNGPKGVAAIEKLYAESCRHICGHHLKDEQEAELARLAASRPHDDCRRPDHIMTANIFHQLLWAKTRPTKLPVTKMRPFAGNTIKYRSEFQTSIFESIIEQLTHVVPSELISNQLWYSSANAHSFWLKTKQFIDSCAAISIVGYIIGLGDRHMENILLDSETGQLIHIDYNICFESGKLLSVPEDIPFRLTPNIMRAFGFAGLQGGFTIACQNILSVLRSNKDTILQLLDPVNFGFMVGGSVAEEIVTKSPAMTKSMSLSHVPKAGIIARPTKQQTARSQLDLCSQESIDVSMENPKEPTDLLMMSTKVKSRHQDDNLLLPEQGDVNLMPPPTAKSQRVKSPLATAGTSNKLASFDLQQNIKTPTQITQENANEIHSRIRDKLSGTDERLSHHRIEPKTRDGLLVDYLQKLGADATPPEEIRKSDSSKRLKSSPDLIQLNEAQSVEDQVDALIAESLSIKNKATIFEGWAPWV